MATSESGKGGVELVNFKAYCEDEIRLLAVDQDMCTNYEYICAKLGQVFPNLKREHFQLAWTTDNHGDEIRISSDEELVIALNEMTGNPYRIKIIKGKGGEPRKVEPKPTQCGEEAIHVNVICHSCVGQVKGYRYKCLVCPDYDLCQTCEAQSVHPDHSMIRIPKPEMTWPGHLFQRLSKLNSKNDKRQQRMNNANANTTEVGQDALKGPWGCRGPRPFGPMGPHGPMGPYELMGPDWPMGPHELMGPDWPMGPRELMGPNWPDGLMGRHGPMGRHRRTGRYGPMGPHGNGVRSLFDLRYFDLQIDRGMNNIFEILKPKTRLGEETTPGQPTTDPISGSGFVDGSNMPSNSQAGDQSQRMEQVIKHLSPMMKRMGVTIERKDMSDTSERKDMSLILQFIDRNKFPFNVDLIFRNIDTHFRALLVEYGARMTADQSQHRIVISFEDKSEASESQGFSTSSTDHHKGGEKAKPTGSVEIPVTVTQTRTERKSHTETTPEVASPEKSRQSTESEEEWILLKEPMGTKPKTNYEEPIQVSNQLASVRYPEFPKNDQSQPPQAAAKENKPEEEAKKRQVSEKVNQAEFEHVDPRIRTSMQAMRSMGFSSMDLLIPLLEEKNGDISLVLDVIYGRACNVRK